MLAGNRVQVGYRRRDLSAKGRPPIFTDSELCYFPFWSQCRVNRPAGGLPTNFSR
ncbi:MAG: hypothetical protein LBK82_14215 [Planctomycetaceae bacterium]|nr:hypothetical protein [Planctomycetaceae bacterium]